MMTLLAIWLALALVCAGVGRLVLRLVRRGRRDLLLLDGFEQAWLGVATLLGLLGLLSLFAPIGASAALGAVALGILGWGLTMREATGSLLRGGRRLSPRAVFRLAVSLLAGLFVAKGANAPITWWDTLSTHLQQVKWIHAYPAVPGLANFSPKLGFDQLHFLMAAALEEGPLVGRTVHVVNGFFTALFAWQWIDTLLRPSPTPRNERARLYALLTVPLVLHKMQFDRELASFSGDLIVAIIAAVFGKLLVSLSTSFGVGSQGRRLHRQQLLLATTLAAFLLAAKLNGAVFVLIGIALLFHARHTAPATYRWRDLFVLCAPAAVIVVAFLLRRAVITGWLLYPIPFGDLHLSWSVPVEELRYQQCWIQSWSRIMSVDCHDVMENGFARWFYPWFASFSKFKEWRLFVGTMVLIVGLLGVRSKLKQTPGELWLVIGLFLSLLLWFWGAPDWRFAVAFFWMLFAWAMMQLLSFVSHRPTRFVIAAVAVLGLAYDGNLLSPKFDNLHWTEVGPPGAAPFKKHTLLVPERQPLEIFVPDGNDLCGDAPLPCTPYPTQQRLRVEGDLSRGFLPARTNSIHDHAVESSPGPTLPRRVTVDLERLDGADSATWYWSQDGAFSESKQTTHSYDKRAKLTWQLPADAKSNRLDPGGKVGSYKIHSIEVECASTPTRTDRLGGASLLAAVAEWHDAKGSLDGDSVAIESASTDPYLALNLPRCTGPTEGRPGLIALSVSAMALLLAAAWYLRRRRG